MDEVNKNMKSEINNFLLIGKAGISPLQTND
jgi:hypothetical protein